MKSQFLAQVAISQLYCGLANDILPALTSDEIKMYVKGQVSINGFIQVLHLDDSKALFQF